MENDITSLNPTERNDWNGLVNHADNIGSSVVDPNIINSYKTVNPLTTLTTDHIPVALNEIDALKGGKPIGGLSPTDAAYIHSGMSDAYKSNPLNLKYPISGTHGTDLESHAGDSGIPGTGNIIPKPNYDDPQSRLNYAQSFTKKYGPLMQGRGDTPLRINEAPDSGSDTAKNLASKEASKHGLDPALFYSSAMEEGIVSGLFPDKNGKVGFLRGRKASY